MLWVKLKLYILLCLSQKGVAAASRNPERYNQRLTTTEVRELAERINSEIPPNPARGDLFWLP